MVLQRLGNDNVVDAEHIGIYYHVYPFALLYRGLYSLKFSGEAARIRASSRFGM